MKEILVLFYKIFSFLAVVTMLYPIITSLIARKSKKEFSSDLKLFEVYIYFVFIFQLFALSLIHIFDTYNVILFRIFLPIHLAMFSYFLLKWAINNKTAILFALLTIPFMFIGDYILGDYNYSPDFKFWADSIILLILSTYLAYKVNEESVFLENKYSYIHIGIYLYSIITIIGITPAYTEIRSFGFVLQSLAVIISNYFFARSFRCLYKQTG